MEWENIQPVKIIFGNGKIKELEKLTQKHNYFNGLLVCSNFSIKSGLADQVIKENKNSIILTFGKVTPNPTVKQVDECAKIIKENNIKFIIALGGGSVIDLAKAVATIALTDDSIVKYHGTGIPIPEEHLPIIAIPTTAGTGSEVTSVSVLTNPDIGTKAPINSKGFYPEYAIIDPELTYSMTPEVTASSGIDVLSHALEGFWSINHQPICEALSTHAIELVFEYLVRAYENPLDKEAREKMAEASLIAGLAFTIPKTTASHACSFPLTNIHHISHGEACGLTLDYFTRLNAESENGRVNNLSKKLGFADANELADKIYALKKRIGLLINLKSFNLTEEEIDELVQASKHPNLLNNPVKVTDEILYEMYHSFL